MRMERLCGSIDIGNGLYDRRVLLILSVGWMLDVSTMPPAIDVRIASLPEWWCA